MTKISVRLRASSMVKKAQRADYPIRETIAEKLAAILVEVYAATQMNPSATSSLMPEQIAAEVTQMRKAARAITASSRKRLEFLRQVGVLNSSSKRQRLNHKTGAVSRGS